jgi:hypothetical protein
MASRKIIPIYKSNGELGALMIYPYLFNTRGEWIGFITEKKEIYSVIGHYVGYLGGGPRILRKRTYNYDKSKLVPPRAPTNITRPATMPLASLMPELPFSVIDILEDEPQRLTTVDAGDLREDLD